MGPTFTKHYAKGQVGSPALEAAGLAWLAEAQASGGAQIARVISYTNTDLTLERIGSSRPTPGAPEALGQALAHTHAAGATHFGVPPPGWSGPGGIGLAPLSHVEEPPPSDAWGAFYYTERLAPYVELAERNRSLPAGGAAVFKALGALLMDGHFDAPQPALCPLVARIHGDLWAGNVLWVAPKIAGQPSWTGAVLIDPAAHGGHAETDLAMLALFSTPGLGRILAAYNQTSPLAPGWENRVDLHQLHPLLVHAALFGGGYGAQAVAKAKRYLRP